MATCGCFCFVATRSCKQPLGGGSCLGWGASVGQPSASEAHKLPSTPVWFISQAQEQVLCQKPEF